MTAGRAAPRIEVDLDRVRHNAASLVAALGHRSISVVGVTKATLGHPEVAHALIDGGVVGLGDSRVENLERLRDAGVGAATTLLRSPVPTQVDLVVALATTSCNTELEVLRMLSVAAVRAEVVHHVVLMVELGDLREGIMAEDLDAVVRVVIGLPNLVLDGIGTNLACHLGVEPSDSNMGQLSSLADSVESTTGDPLERVSGGNSANLRWALASPDPGRVNELRLGESILLGRQPLDRSVIEGLHTDAVRVVAEVIESKVKPSVPSGRLARTAFGTARPPEDRGDIRRVILALGRQDVDPDGLVPMLDVDVLGASSDHLVVDARSEALRVGSEVAFEPDYAALVRAMTSPFVRTVVRGGSEEPDGR